MFGATRERLIKRYKEEWKQKPPKFVTSARRGQEFFWGLGYHEVLLENGATGQCFATAPLTKHGEKVRKVFPGICLKPLLPTDKRLVVPKRRTAKATKGGRRDVARRALKTMPRKRLLPFHVVAAFRSWPDPETEKLLEKVTRRKIEGPSFMYAHAPGAPPGVSFGFVRRTQAIAAAKRIKKAELRRCVAVTVSGRVWP